MHSIRRQGSLDDLTATHVRKMIDRNTYELFDRQEARIKHLTLENIELLQQLTQCYQD